MNRIRTNGNIGRILLVLIAATVDGQQTQTVSSSPSCSYFTARTFQIESLPTDVLVINIRQNVQGTVKFLEQPKRAPRVASSSSADHRVTVAVNWTSDSAELLDRVHTEWTSVDTISGKLITIQLDADSLEKSSSKVPVIAGSSAAGVVVVGSLIVAAICVARRNSSRAAPQKQLAKENTVSDNGRQHEQLEDYDVAIYPNSIFTAGEGDDDDVDDEIGDGGSASLQASAVLGAEAVYSEDDSTLNLSTLYCERAMADERGFRRAASGASTDRASSISRHSSRRSEVKGGTHYEVIRPMLPQGQAVRSNHNRCPGTGAMSASLASHGRPYDLGRHIHQQVASAAAGCRRNGSSATQAMGATPLSVRRARYTKRTVTAGSYSLTASSAAEEEEDEGEARVAAIVEAPREFASSPDEGPAATSSKAAIGCERARSSSPLLAKSVALFAAISLLSGGAAYALCGNKPAANIVIVIPAGARIGSIKLFSNQNLRSYFVETDWYLQNRGLFHVYDVDDVPITSNRPCSVRMHCPAVANKTLAECDLGTQACVCARGYKMNSRFVCEDVDECKRDVCSHDTTCRNTVGSFDCLCPVGSYRQGLDCVPCSRGCPDDQFEAGACTTSADRVCQVCQKCRAGSYAFRRCSDRQDNECIRDGVQVEKSTNVFVDELDMKPAGLIGLEHISYVADNSQSQGFVWERASGLRVYVEMTDLDVVPQYRGVQHEADENQLMLNHPNADMRRMHNEVRANYCSQAIPDYYTLTLKVHRKRATAVDYIVCNSTRKNCPPYYRDGEEFTQRSFNTKCPKESPDYETNRPVPTIADGGNSVLCTRRTQLLSELFKQVVIAKDEELAFPTIECRQSMYKCEECLKAQAQCDEKAGSRNMSCCAVTCHTTEFCKEATSPACDRAPVECAVGDLLQYVLQPNYQANTFQCHVERVRPQRLLRLTYHVTVPTMLQGWNSSRKSLDVVPSDNSGSVGTTTTDFFTIRHDISLDVSDELLLRGTATTAGSAQYNFSVTDFKAEEISDAPAASIETLNYSPDVWLARIKPSRPFEVSTSSWQARHGCDIDVSGVLRAPRRSSSVRAASLPTLVDITTNRATMSNELRYSMTSKKLPSIKLTVPGNQSVLSSLFTVSTVDFSSVRVELVPENHGTLWEILVTGHARQCDAYVSVSVADRTSHLPLARYDCIVSCVDVEKTPSFWMRVKMAKDKSQDILRPAPLPFGKLLQVDVSDSLSSVTYYVTTNNLHGEARSAPSFDTVSVAMVPAIDDNRAERNLPQSAAVVGVASLTVALFVTLSYILATACLAARRRRNNKKCSDDAPGNKQQLNMSLQSVAPLRKRHRRGTVAVLVTVCCLYRIAYACVFSFTMLMLVSSHFTGDSRSVLQEFGTFHDRTIKDSEVAARRTHDWRVTETQRQLQALDERLTACSAYSASKRRELSQRVTMSSEGALHARWHYESARHEALLSRLAGEHAKLAVFVESIRRNSNLRASALLEAYGSTLDEIYSNDWLRSPNDSFLQWRGDTGADARGIFSSEHRTLVQKDSTGFLAFLGIERPLSVDQQLTYVNRRLATVDCGIDFLFSKSANYTEALPFSNMATYSRLLLQARTPAKKSASEYVEPQKLSSTTMAARLGGMAAAIYVILAILDAAIFTYRMCSLASTVKHLQRGFEKHKEMHCSPERGLMSKSTGLSGSGGDQATDVSGYQVATLKSHHSSQCKTQTAVTTSVGRRAFGMLMGGSLTAHAYRATCWLAFVALALLSVDILDKVLTRRVLLHASGVGHLADGANEYVAAGNTFAISHAAQLTRLADARMRHEFDPVLHHMLKHDLLHKQETDWFIKLHETRRCTIQGLPEKSCFNSNSSLLLVGSLDIAPCQALPITPRQQVADTFRTISRSVVSNDFQKYVNALRSTILTNVGLVIMFANVMVTVYVAELAVSHFFKSKDWVPTVKVTTVMHRGLCVEDESDSECENKDEGDENGIKLRSSILDTRSLRSEAISEPRSVMSEARSDARSARSDIRSARSAGRYARSDTGVSVQSEQTTVAMSNRSSELMTGAVSNRSVPSRSSNHEASRPAGTRSPRICDAASPTGRNRTNRLQDGETEL